MPRKRYKVVGTQPVHGHPPGDTFTASLHPDEEKYLKDIGAIRVATKTPKNKRISIDKAAAELAREQEAAKRNPDGEPPAA
jgi:hypothetical protein